MRYWCQVAVLVLLVSACGAGTSSDDTAGPVGSVGEDETSSSGSLPGGEIRSEDGRATLSLPEGALPDDVSTDDVSLTVVSKDSDEPGVPVLAVQLLPDGLVLSEPATLTFDLPESVEGGFMVIHQSGGTIEFLGGEIEQDADGLYFTTPVAHFSAVLMIQIPGVFDSSLELSPETVGPDEIQLADVAVAKETKPFSVWARLPFDPLDTWRLFEFSAPKLQSVKYSHVSWIHTDDGNEVRNLGHWDPGIFNVEFTPSSLEATVSSTCLRANRKTVLFMAGLGASSTRNGRGAPTTKSELSIFAEVLTPESATPIADDRTDLSKAGPGDEVEMQLWTDASARSVCADEVATATTTTSTTVPVGTSSTSTSTTTTEPPSTATQVPAATVDDLLGQTLEVVAVESGHLTSNGSLVDVVDGAPALELHTSVFQDGDGRVYQVVEGPRELVEPLSWEWDALAGPQVVSETSLIGTSPQPAPSWVYETPNGTVLTHVEFPIDVGTDVVVGIICTDTVIGDGSEELSNWAYWPAGDGAHDFVHFSVDLASVPTIADEVIDAVSPSTATPGTPNATWLARPDS